MEGDGSSILAWEGALDRLGGDRQFLAEMIGCFLVDLESQLVELRGASSEGDTRLMASLASAVEQKASELGAEALARAARELAGSTAAGEAHLQDVVVQAACLRGYLRGLQERSR
jgi:HPt (histidine-containing phosphotransfer) domain-containing protein